MKIEEAEPTAADRADRMTRLERELTDELLAKIAEHAERYVTQLRLAGIPIHRRTHHELAQDAAVDTIEGRREWDGTYPLIAHLKMVVTSRVMNLLAHQKRHRHKSIAVVAAMEEVRDERRIQPVDLSPIALPRPPRPSRVASLRDAAAQMLDAARTVLAADAAALAVLDAWERGETERADGIEGSGLPPAAYDAAVKRIQRAVKCVPEPLRDSAQDAMEVSHGA